MNLQITHPVFVLEGAGVPVKRILPSLEVDYKLLDPFLLLDEVNLEPDFNNQAFPDHPHRGFEIITYMLSGASLHKDSEGNIETINEGDAQKITTGSGMFHGEGPIPGQNFHALQLWVNLSKENKKLSPSYQLIRKAEFPVKVIDDAEVKYLVGIDAPIKLHTPTVYLDVNLKSNGYFHYQMPGESNSVIYLLEGTMQINGHKIDDNDLVILEKSKNIEVITGRNKARFIILDGQPLKEEVLWFGPFVD